MNVKISKKKTIVFVEDNPIVLMAYRNRLEQEGFHIEPAQDGLEAMKILARLVPDLVVLDLMLPKFSGVDVLKFIQSNSRLKNVPIVILSSSSIVDAADEYVLERVTKQFFKDSCTPATMLQAVHELLSDSTGQKAEVPPNHAGTFQPAKGKTVLLVEDNPVVLTAYRNRLQQEGYHIESAQDGLEAMRMLARLVPDLVVLDLLLPKFNGVDVLKFVRSNARLKEVPIIILSANSIIDVAEEYVLERANKRFLKGSCTPAIMLQAIQGLLADPSGSSGNQSDASQPAESKTDGVLAGTKVAG
jgi:DNA-binding response OmpR family regulator